MYVCSLHFEEWMYMKKYLKSAAIPVLNLPSASIHSVSTQTEAPVIELTADLHDRIVQQQINTTSVGVSVVAPSSAQTLQTSKIITDHTPRKRKLRKQIKSCVKKLKSTDVTRQQFLRGCDKFLPPNLSKIVKAQINLKHHSKSNRYFKRM